MRFDFQVLFILVAIGLLTKRLSWKGWFAVGLFMFSWLIFCWKKG